MKNIANFTIARSKLTPTIASPSKTPARTLPKINTVVITNVITKLIIISSEVVAGAVVFFVLAHFVPELREQLPSFYEIVDAILWGFGKLCDFVVGSLHFLCNNIQNSFFFR